jgi:nucleotide-binding universal stress UspA family protein
VILLHVMDAVPAQPADVYFGGMTSLVDVKEWTNRASQMLTRFQEIELAHVPVETRLETGDPASIITEVAASVPADLIVMPTHGYGPFRRFILGSVTAKVLHDSACPVWTGVHLEEAPEPDSISIGSVVCGLDLQNGGQVVLEAAAFLAKDMNASLTLVHAVPGSDAIPERLMDCELRRHLKVQARETIRALMEEQQIRASVCIDSGEPAAVIRRAAEAYKADLAIIGRGHHAGLGRLRTHSYSIIRESPCPVLSI